MTEVVKLNVGGQAYQVTRSFLALHPQTMLAKIASTQWQKNPESEIFIDRDGEMFRHVLSYLRDGRVDLPVTVAKNGLLLELAFYGVEGVDKANIDDSLVKGPQTAHAKVHMDEVCTSLEKMSNSALFARMCIKKWPTIVSANNQWKFVVQQNEHDYSLTKIVLTNLHQLRADCNVHLKKVGLQIHNINKSNGSKITVILNYSISNNVSRKRHRRETSDSSSSSSSDSDRDSE